MFKKVVLFNGKRRYIFFPTITRLVSKINFKSDKQLCLEKLDLSGKKLSDEETKQLKRFTSLKRIRAVNNNIDLSMLL